VVRNGFLLSYYVNKLTREKLFASGTHYAISLSWIATSVWRP
ncbi:9530_t:CDS:2, partial [Entrophospora sp. SA101]